MEIFEWSGVLLYWTLNGLLDGLVIFIECSLTYAKKNCVFRTTDYLKWINWIFKMSELIFYKTEKNLNFQNFKKAGKN